MGNSLAQWRMTVGVFYNRCQRSMMSSKVSINFSIKFNLFHFVYKLLQILLLQAIAVKSKFLNEYFYFIWIHLLLILSGDVETNPGPVELKHSLSVLHTNIRSIRNKLNYIKDEFLDYDILCFTETHLDANISTDESLLIQNYDSPYRKDRTNHGGGLLVYINSNLVHERVNELEQFWDECIWFKIKQKSNMYLIGLFYSPKTSDRNFFERLNQNLEKAMELTKNVIVLGDLNEDLLLANNYNLKNVMLVNSMQNIINEPTRGRALLDPILVNFDQIVLDCGILTIPSEISDHNATFIEVPFEYNVRHIFKRKVWLYKYANYAELENKINNHDWNNVCTLPLDQAVEYFNTIFLNFVQECIPSKEVTVRSDDKPWYDNEIRKFSRKRDRLKTTAVTNKRSEDWRKYKKVRNKVNNMKKFAKERFYNNLEHTITENYSQNKRDFWKLTRYFVKSNTASASIPPLYSTDENGDIIMHTTDKEKADCLNDYFTSISRVCDENVHLPEFQKITNSTLHSITISENEVKDILSTLNVNKASGPDSISHKMLKYVSNAVSKPLTILFNRSLAERHFPEPWKRNNVVSLYKKGEKSDPANYRPVSLSSPVGKVMERVVFKNMYNYVKDNSLLYKYQSGFIPGHSTTFQLIDIYHHICQTFDNKQISCMVFCDISKAFDRVWHKGLLFKLKQNGIEGDLLNWLSSYLSNRKQRVVLNSSFSETKDVSAGVPQGSVLGPLLFLIYVNDIAEQLLSLTRLYADDSSLFVSASNIRDIEGILNHDLAIICKWAKQWLINFNPNKTVAVLFSLMELSVPPNLIFDGVPIQFVNNHRHLGVTLHERGKWHDHIEKILSSASKVIGVMRKLKYTFSYHSLNQIYISYVRPILEYSSIVWDNCTAEQAGSLEKLQNEAARIVTGLTRSVSLERLYRECNWDSLTSRRYNQKLKFMYKATHDMVPSYIDDLIPQLVGETSRYDLRNRNDITVLPQRTTIFQNSCIPSSIRAWNSLADQYRNCQTYGSFCYRIKNDFNSPTKIPNHYHKGKRKLVILHCRLRNRCSDLHADLFYNHLRDNALCDCQQDIEDAEHFIFRCSRYDHERIIMFHRTRQFHPLSVSDALYGKTNLSDDDNSALFEAIQTFIKETGRFDAN